MIGPPGCLTKETTLKLSQHFESITVSVGDLLKKEVVKKTDLGRQIEEFIVQKIYVPDSFVIEVLQKYIAGVGRSSLASGAQVPPPEMPLSTITTTA